MPRVPTPGSTITGINARSPEGARKPYMGNDRRVEEAAFKNIQKNKKRMKREELCEVHVLPDGIVCEARKEKNGFMFCVRNKEGCPLRE